MLFVTNSGLSIFETPNVEAAVAAIDSRMSCFVFQESSISLYYLCDDPLASAPLSRESGLDSNLLKRLTRVGFNFTHSFRWGIFAFARSLCTSACLPPCGSNNNSGGISWVPPPLLSDLLGSYE